MVSIKKSELKQELLNIGAIAVAYIFIVLLNIFDWDAGIYRGAVLALLLGVLVWSSRREMPKPLPVRAYLFLAVAALLVYSSYYFVAHINSTPIDVGLQSLDAYKTFFINHSNPYATHKFPYFPLQFMAYAPLIFLFKAKAIYIGNYLFYLASVWLVFRISSRVYKSEGIGLLSAVIMLEPFLMPHELFFQGVSDIIPVCLALAAVYYTRKPEASGLLTGLSLAAKQIPGGFLFALLFLKTRARKFYLAFVLPILLLVLPFFLWDRDNFMYFVLLQYMGRPADSTSIAYYLPAGVSAVWTLAGLVGILGVLYWWFREKEWGELKLLYGISWIMIVFLIFNSMVHRNYLITLIPLVAILFPKLARV